MSHCHTVTLQFLFDSMALILPQEITDHIIDAIAKSHIPAFSLCSCSLVSKSFSYRSRYHLFREISICAVGENQMLKILQSFLDILISKPIAGCRLLLFIKSFEVEIGGLAYPCHRENKINCSVNFRGHFIREDGQYSDSDHASLARTQLRRQPLLARLNEAGKW